MFKFLLFSNILYASTPQIEGTVIKINNGDTLTILDKNKQKQKVRLAQIDSPEAKQDFGSEAHTELVKLCHIGGNAKITVESERKDKYKRKIGTVYCDDKNVNLELVKKGLAWVYTKYAWDPKYKDAEEEAKNAKIGLWSKPNPVPPWVYRCYERQKKDLPQTFKAGCSLEKSCGEIIKCMG